MSKEEMRKYIDLMENTTAGCVAGAPVAVGAVIKRPKVGEEDENPDNDLIAEAGGTGSCKAKIDLDLNLKSGKIIPAGTNLAYEFVDNQRVSFSDLDGNHLKMNITSANKYVSKFSACPSISKLDRQSMDGVCTTPTGHRVEPDGHGPDGSPSWLLVMGII